jgi:type III secretion system YscD/HrpQ family protein
MELRVLSGPQAGCALPLRAGTYRAGADDCCDIVLEDLPAGEIAFVIYAGHKVVALESLVEGVGIAGRPARGLCELRPGRLFEFRSWVFTVDDPSAPWPQDVESMRSAVQAASSDSATEAGDLQGAGLAALDTASADPEGEASRSAGERASVLPREDGAAGPPSADKAGPGRRRPPFWVIGLAGTAAFLASGVLALTLSLAPSRPAPASDPTRHALALNRVAASATGGAVKLERLLSGRFRLSGQLATRLQRTTLTRDARAVDPSVLVHVSADEDLEALARETLARFPGAGVELAGVRLGRLTLKGHVPDGQMSEQIVAALRDGVPGLTAVDNQVTANDDAPAPATAPATAPGSVNANVEMPRKVQRHHAPQYQDDVVAVVMGPIPYVLLRDGTKQALPAPARVTSKR